MATMAAMRPTLSYSAYEQAMDEDAAMWQRKMTHQRQLALSKQKKTATTSFGVVAKDDSPFAAALVSNKLTGWGEILQGRNADVTVPDRSPTSALVKVVVPPGSTMDQDIMSPMSQGIPSSASTPMSCCRASMVAQLDASTNSLSGLGIDVAELDSEAESRSVFGERDGRLYGPKEIASEKGWDLDEIEGSPDPRARCRSRKFRMPWAALKRVVTVVAQPDAVSAFDQDSEDAELSNMLTNSSVSGRAATPWVANLKRPQNDPLPEFEYEEPDSPSCAQQQEQVMHDDASAHDVPVSPKAEEPKTPSAGKRSMFRLWRTNKPLPAPTPASVPEVSNYSQWEAPIEIY